MTRIAIIGAGMAGLTAATQLAPHAHVEVFEKSWRAGGRMATRHYDSYSFDHGAQYFTAKSEAFQQFLQPWLAQGVVMPWHAQVALFTGYKRTGWQDWRAQHPRYVAQPHMDSLCRALAAPLTVHYQTQIETIKHKAGQWQLHTQQGQNLGSFDWVIVAIPAEQACALMPTDFEHLARLQACQTLPCHTLMLGFAEEPEVDFDAARFQESALSWLSINHHKPQRPQSPATWVLHANNHWSAQHSAQTNDWIEQTLLIHLQKALAQPLQPDYQVLQRWRYANVTVAAEEAALFDVTKQLTFIGDGCLGGKVEAAFLSGIAGAKSVSAAC